MNRRETGIFSCVLTIAIVFGMSYVMVEKKAAVMGMASDKEIVDFLVEQLKAAGAVEAKKMFGEYGLYCDRKIVGLICDDQLFIKPTKEGRAFLDNVTEGIPYPGAKPYFLISGEYWDDAQWLSDLVRVTAASLPKPSR